MTRSVVVDPQRWAAFARDFTRSHDGWSASLELRNVDGGLEVAVDDRPFRGLVVEGHDTPSLIVTFGDDPDEHLAHIVERPQAITELRADDGSQSTLVVDEEGGTGCVVELTSPFIEE
jgi:hypothetical protein